jgi:putative SOS response-associated peptidase YedK
MFLAADDILVAFDLDEVLTSWVPKYNVAPGQQVLAVTEEKPRAAVGLNWGMNFHSEREKRDVQLINIRSETILEKGHFRRPKYNPCLILANGFYEWRKDAGKQPFYLSLKNNKPFAFAGIYTVEDTKDQKPEKTCAILTCQPNSLVGTVHNRMPVILEQGSMRGWLNARTHSDYLKFLQPYSAEKMNCHPVGKMVNRPAYDAPDCIIPV